MVKKLNPIKVQETLREKGFRMFTPREFRLIFDVSQSAAQKFIHQHTKKGFFIKLRGGLYVVKGNEPTSYEVANRLYKPSYISLETALAHYGIIPEVVYSLTSLTTKATQSFTAMGQSFEYTRVKKSAYTGYSLQKEGGRGFLIAEPEKALADYLYFVSLGKKTLNDRLSVRRLDKKMVLKYAALFARPKLLLVVEEAWKMAEAEKEIF